MGLIFTFQAPMYRTPLRYLLSMILLSLEESGMTAVLSSVPPSALWRSRDTASLSSTGPLPIAMHMMVAGMDTRNLGIITRYASPDDTSFYLFLTLILASGLLSATTVPHQTISGPNSMIMSAINACHILQSTNHFESSARILMIASLSSSKSSLVQTFPRSSRRGVSQWFEHQRLPNVLWMGSTTNFNTYLLTIWLISVYIHCKEYVDYHTSF